MFAVGSALIWRGCWPYEIRLFSMNAFWQHFGQLGTLFQCCVFKWTVRKQWTQRSQLQLLQAQALVSGRLDLSRVLWSSCIAETALFSNCPSLWCCRGCQITRALSETLNCFTPYVANNDGVLMRRPCVWSFNVAFQRSHRRLVNDVIIQ